MLSLKKTLCRACLAVVIQPKAFNIFNTENLAKKLMFCSGQPVESKDEYPEQLCKNCYGKIVLFYEFQQMCCKSLVKFRNLINTEQEGEVSNRENFNTGNSKQDLELNSISSPASYKTFEKKKSGRPERNKSDNLKIERMTVIKQPCRSVISEIISGSSNSKDKTRNNLKEYLQSSKGDGVYEKNENISTNQSGFEEKDESNSKAEEVEVGDFNNENENKQQQQIEEMILKDASERSPMKEIECMEEYHCNRCSLQLKSLFKLQIHIRQHDGLPPYLCSFKGCESSFDRWHSYKKHQKGHNANEQSYKCDLDSCERVYKNKSNLNIHKRKFHNFGPKLKTHMCEICGKVFKSSAVLNDHHFTHIDRTQFPYPCEEEGCKKRFSNKEKLKIHKMRHAGIKNFVCPHCGMRKTTRNELKIHINYHTLERTWPCRFCPKVCNSAGNLKMHVKNMHEGAKDFACRFCERTFAKADTKKYHEMTHTGEKPNECKDCGRRFVQPAALRTHRKIHLRQKEKLPDNQKSKVVIVGHEKSCDAGIIDETNLLTESIVAEILSNTPTS